MTLWHILEADWLHDGNYKECLGLSLSLCTRTCGMHTDMHQHTLTQAHLWFQK